MKFPNRSDVVDLIYIIGVAAIATAFLFFGIYALFQAIEQSGRNQVNREWQNFTVRQGLAEYVPGDGDAIVWRWTYSDAISSEVPN